MSTMRRQQTMYPQVKESILSGARMNGRVVLAMICRDAAQRFGSGPLSYAWTLVEPSILVAVMLLVRVYLKNYAAAFGDSSALFLLTGYLTFRVATRTINTAGRAIQSNRALLEFGIVKPPDVVISKVVVEFSIWLVILVLFFTVVGRILGHQIIANFQDFVLALIYTFYFCVAMSFFNATIGALVPLWRSMWKIATVPLLFVSGVLYVPASMPPEVISIIKWNPFLHCIEGIRSASYLDYISLFSPTYLNTVSTIVLIFSLALERLFRKEILRSSTNDDDEEEV